VIEIEPEVEIEIELEVVIEVEMELEMEMVAVKDACPKICPTIERKSTAKRNLPFIPISVVECSL